MKIKILLKDPDGFDDGLRLNGVNPEEIPSDIQEVLSQFVEFSEFITVEFDTETFSARVVPVSEPFAE